MTDSAGSRDVPQAGLACSLSPGEWEDRGLWLAGVVERATHIRTGPNGVHLTLAGGEEAEADARALARVEGLCCPFLTFDIRRVADRVELVVTGPPEARPTIEAMFEATR